MHDTLKPLVKNIAEDPSLNTEGKLQAICDLLRDRIPYYDWVGFYFHEEDKKVLHLKSFSGEPTDHTTIPFGKGICGQVALTNKNFVVPDVKAQDNYIACSIDVKSEIVVPIFVNGKNIGQIDIDSHTLNPFTRADEDLLEFVAETTGDFL